MTCITAFGIVGKNARSLKWTRCPTFQREREPGCPKALRPRDANRELLAPRTRMLEGVDVAIRLELLPDSTGVLSCRMVTVTSRVGRRLRSVDIAAHGWA
jgi:hypothetical protein